MMILAMPMMLAASEPASVAPAPPQPALVTVQAPPDGAQLPSRAAEACRRSNVVCYIAPAPDCPPEKAAHGLCFSGQVGAIRNEAVGPVQPLRLAIPSPDAPVPQDSFAPELADVPGCVWRELEPASRTRIRAVAKGASAMGPLKNWGMETQAQGIDLVTPAHRCDPRWRFHYLANFMAWRIGVTEGLSLERLDAAHFQREAVEAVWREDTALQRNIVGYFADLDAHDVAAARLKSAAMKPLLQAAWARLGGKVEAEPGPESAQMAARSYWIARGWETEALGPLTKPRPN
jgi:hypothetical protein